MASGPGGGGTGGTDDLGPADVKIILLGDSAVGKSKLVERFLMDDFQPRQLSTFALTLFRHAAEIDGQAVSVDFWDTAGQERFQNLHPSYYHGANACILVFDVERKVTYKNLEKWFSEMRHYCETIPCICVANKIDTNEKVINAKFKFPTKHGLAFEFCSAADGTNVVKLFNDAIRAAWEDKHSEDRGFMGDVLDLLADETLGTGDTSLPTRAAAAKDGEGDVSK